MMKSLKKLLFFIFMFSLVFTSFSFASNNSSQKSSKNETIKVFNTDLYLGQQDVVVNDAVNGNIFAFGSTVTIKGEILGDIFILAQTLTIEETATVHGNLFAFANNIMIKGKVNYDIYSYSQNFELSDTGYANRDIRIAASTAKLYGSIKKDAFLFVNHILMPDKAENIIGGNLHYTSDKEFTFPEKAIMGKVEFTKYQARTLTLGEVIAKYVKKFISDISLAIVVILLSVFLAPKWLEKVHYALMKKSFVSTGIGVLAVVLIPVLAFFLFLTGLFTSLSIAIIAIYGLILAISLSIFSLAIAKSITEKLKITSKGKFILFAILSAIVLWLAQRIPYIGTYLSLFIHTVGLGVFLFSFIKEKNKV